MIGRRRAVEVLLLWRIASSQLDAVGPGRSGLGHHHAQQRVIGLHVVRRSVLHRLRRHDVLAVADSELPLSFPRVVRLSHALLVPTTAATSATTLVPRPVRLFRKRRGGRGREKKREM